jgi:1-phosphofructokinase family hexose kinase
MILSVTSNPSIDRTLSIPQLTVGAVNRATGAVHYAGGKGLNVSRAVSTLGGDVVTTGPLAGHLGQIVADLAAAEGLTTDWYWLKTGETRLCLLLNHESGADTVINEPGPASLEKAWGKFAAHIRGLAAQAGAVAFMGSVPPAVPPEALGELARSLVSPDRTVYLDTSGQPLASALAQPAGLAIKINRTELAEGLNLADSSPAQLIEAGQSLLKRGAALVVVTLGAEGALTVTPQGSWQATPPALEAVSTVGSGDSLLAGLAVTRLAGGSMEAALAVGVACGAANALTRLPGRFERAKMEMLLEQVQCDNISQG